jgi:hypothetical protein
MKIKNWMKMLLAVLLGNVIYFLIAPGLPDFLAHNTFRVDPGLFVDMAICAVVYLVIRRIVRN